MANLNNLSTIAGIITAERFELVSERFADDGVEQDLQPGQCLVISFWNDQVVALPLQRDKVQTTDRRGRAHADASVCQTRFYARGDFEMGEHFVGITFDALRWNAMCFQLLIQKTAGTGTFFPVD